MLIHIANLMEADRRSATADEVMPLGCVTISSADDSGLQRKLNKLTLANQFLPGRNGIAWKVSADPMQVTSSTVNTDSRKDLGSRIVSIAEGDQIVEVRKGALVTYDVSLLDASLDPARSGALPVVGEALAVNPVNSLFCDAAVAGALTNSFGVVFEILSATKITIELVA